MNRRCRQDPQYEQQIYRTHGILKVVAQNWPFIGTLHELSSLCHNDEEVLEALDGLDDIGRMIEDVRAGGKGHAGHGEAMGRGQQTRLTVSQMLELLAFLQAHHIGTPLLDTASRPRPTPDAPPEEIPNNQKRCKMPNELNHKEQMAACLLRPDLGPNLDYTSDTQGIKGRKHKNLKDLYHFSNEKPHKESTTLYRTELADEDPHKQGVGIRNWAFVMVNTLTEFQDNKLWPVILKQEVMAKLQEEINTIQLHLEKLSFGKTHRSAKASSTPEETEVEDAAKVVYAWLEKKPECGHGALALVLDAMSLRGGSFVAEVHTKVMEAMVHHKPITQEAFLAAIKALRKGEEHQADLSFFEQLKEPGPG